MPRTTRHESAVGSPLVGKPIRKKKGTKTPFEPASVIPGVKHFIEGQPKVSSATIPGSPWAQRLADIGIGHRIDRFDQQQKARQRITPIADPEAGKQERRRTAARKRMRGRLGTLLSNRETLA